MAPKSLIKIVSWNYRGFGGPSTISQLKETLRRQEPDLSFTCEIKQKKKKTFYAVGVLETQVGRSMENCRPSW